MIRKLIVKYHNIPLQIRASCWFLICAFLQKGISCITTPIFTRLLSASEYGQFNIYASWESIMLIVVSLNLWSGVYTQGIVKYENEKKQYSSSLQGLTITLVLLWSIIYVLLHNWVNKLFSLTTVQMVCMFIMIWTSSAFSFWSGSQRVDFKYQKLVIITILVTIAKPLISIIFILLAQDKVTARIIALTLVEFIFYSGCFLSHMKIGKVFFSKKYWTYALKFNFPLLPHYLSMSILNSADRIMIGRMVGKDKAGIYSLAYSISLIMSMFNNALLQTLEPWIYKKIKDRKIEDLSRVAYPSFIIIAVVNIVLILWGPEIVSLFAPEQYHDAIWVIPPVAMSVYFTFAYTFFAPFEFYYEKQKNIVTATLAGAILNIILNYFFIRVFGYYAAGYTTLLCYILYAAFHYYFMRKICKDYINNRQPYNIKILFTITIIFMILGFVILFLYNYRILRYGIIFISGLVMIAKKQIIISVINKLITIKKYD